jgi:Rrf2 family transcriptional regulator, nitric oxide-sensitive transcriptional repressor
MQLTRHTDYALRLLIHLSQAEGNHASIAKVAAAQNISRTHLMKIANELVHAGFLTAARGRGGGIALARPAADINLGAVIGTTEPHCALIDCAGCKLIPICTLPRALSEAARAFHDSLARYSLADMVKPAVGSARF